MAVFCHGCENNVRNKIFVFLITSFIFAVNCTSAYSEENLSKECKFAHEKLLKIGALQISNTPGVFSLGKDVFTGCMVRMKGNFAKVGREWTPRSIFFPHENSILYRQGWRADMEADGPDGTSFRITRLDKFCLVRGKWDGGDDSDPGYIPNTDFSITVKCSVREYRLSDN